MPFPTSGRRNAVLLFVVLLALGAGMAVWWLWGRAEVRAERLLRSAREQRAAGDLRAAESSALQAVKLNPQLAAAAMLAAECAVAQNELGAALNSARLVTAAHPALRIRAALLEAQINHYRLYHLGEAEQGYREALEGDPENLAANDGLAKLLGLCGRRDEAIPYVLELIDLGRASDLLVMLARDSGALNDPELLSRARQAAPDDPNPLLGMATQAAAEENSGRAIDLLRELLRDHASNVPAQAALGKQLLAAGRFDELAAWSTHLPAGCDASDDVWLARGQLAERANESRAAIRCYLEAAERSPESKTAQFRLVQLLEGAGRPEESRRFAEHLQRLQELERTQDRVLFSSERPSVRSQLVLARGYENAGRIWEAWGWAQIALQMDSQNIEARQDEQRLRQLAKGLPRRLTIDAANVARSIDRSAYPLPAAATVDGSQSPNGSPPPSTEAGPVEFTSTPTFRDDASAVGLQFQYFNGTKGTPTRRMYEFTGGGIAVLDADRDGAPDVFFSQGVPWPPGGPTGDDADRLFRNRGGKRFEPIESLAGIHESGFGQGATVGDIDGDGFPDLYVANIGANQLWKNNGDGTFSNVTEESGIADNGWTTSCLMADLDADGLPDIYDVNYVQADDVFDRICRAADGSPRMCMPFDFDSQSDRFWRNDGQGGFTDATADFFVPPPDGKGLGIAVWDSDGSGRLSVLVANDTTPSFFYVPQAAAGSHPVLEEVGVPAGLGLNGDGKATGCMGIALDDLDDDGRMDVYITNFLGESNSLFQDTGGGAFRDRTRELGLSAPSLEQLGFGTQFLDADLDTHIELFVANGHIDDLRSIGRPYRMPAQLFRWNGREFIESPAAKLGPYFEKQWLGRAVARIDWNQDGREDLLVGNLDDASALLTNTTADIGNYVGIRLVGLEGSRDAIGAAVTGRVGEQMHMRQLTAGDGYQSSNERRLVFGLGRERQLSQTAIHWPGGRLQEIGPLEAGHEYLIVEGQPPQSAARP